MCDALGCVGRISAYRTGHDPKNRSVMIALCVAHRQAFDSGEAVVTAAGELRE